MNSFRKTSHVRVTASIVLAVMLSLGLGTASGARGRMTAPHAPEPQTDYTRYGVKKTAPVTQRGLKQNMKNKGVTTVLVQRLATAT